MAHTVLNPVFRGLMAGTGRCRPCSGAGFGCAIPAAAPDEELEGLQMVTAASALFRQLPVDQLRRLAFPLRPGCTQGQVKPWPQPCHQSIRTGRPDLSHALGALSLLFNF